jgi:phage terminase small subunit
MAKTKKAQATPDKYATLKAEIIQDMESRNAYKSVDEHLVDSYLSQLKIIDSLLEEISDTGVTTEGQRQAETVANPALVRLPSLQSGLLQTAKILGIGPYSRKLTTGTEQPAQKEVTKVSQLRPIERTKKTN